MKWIVIWFVLNSWIVPCEPQEPIKFVDKYGRESYSLIQTDMLCYDSETKEMTKEFKSYGEAYRFMVNAQVECQECGEFKIIKQETIN